MITIAPITLKRCRRCGGEYDVEVFFRKHVLHASSTSRRSHPVCIGCELEDRTELKQQNRLSAKARDAIRRHAPKYDMPAPAFATRFGWAVNVVQHGFEHAYANGCSYCHRPFASMGHGFSDITIDICNRDDEPHFETNTKFCCQTCNREKGTMPPHLWARKLRAWQRYEQNKLQRAMRATFGLPLFDCVGCAA